MGIVDFHSHVLPGIDDGSRDVDETMLLLGMEYQQGVTHVVATPHFYAEQDPVDGFLARRAGAVALVREAARGRAQLPALFVGAEVYYFPGMGEAGMLPRLCIEGTSVILLEMPFCQWDGGMARDIQDILEKQKLTIVLAHVERYYKFQKDWGAWDGILAMPVHMQMNGGCFLDWKRRRLASKILKGGHTALLGSDCHNTKVRPPNLKGAREAIHKKMGQRILDQADGLAWGLLKGASDQGIGRP